MDIHRPRLLYFDLVIIEAGGLAMKRKRTPKAAKVNTRSHASQVHMHRIGAILVIFFIGFAILGGLLLNGQHQLATVNSKLDSAQTTLAKKQAKNKRLNKKVKLLHNEDYRKQILREKYDYAKKGETIYNLVK